MIVAALIGLLASLTIPNLFRMRMNASQAAVKSDLKSFRSAAESFRSASNPPTYPRSMAAFTDADPPYLDFSWRNAEREPGRNGYVFMYSSSGVSYSLFAFPWTLRFSWLQGARIYCVDQSGTIFQDASGAGPEGCRGGTPLSG